jgi:hypothetical protein
VGVHVHEAGGDEAAPGVDLLGAAARDLAHDDDAPAGHGHVGLEGGRAGAVDHLAAADHQIISPFHGRLLECSDFSAGLGAGLPERICRLWGGARQASRTARTPRRRREGRCSADPAGG